uniref:Protein TIC 214 n=1 Tax=Agrostemma githago TaxID=39848 RepID=V9PET3_AGRGI|nr:hypothetical chloroplast RF19 [Agrostemma githago]AGZ17981.1 hypothetical chloroplast RF19 [Agrostemma githago]
MIFQSFLLGNLVSLCMKIINSVVVVGLYYGFLTTFSIGPSYLFLLRARVMEEGEEGTEKKVSATTGFIMGQLMMFISIYYTPLHLALGRPHTITVLALPYLLFHFFWNNQKFFDYGSTSRNSMRNLSIQCVFLNNLIFQLFNHFILPSSMLARLVNIYMFRCNNKMLFVTSSFVGWLIGHILFMKWVGLVLVWIQQNHSIRSNVLIRSNKYLVSEFKNSMARIFSILLFITCVYYLGRMPSTIFTKKLKETSETKETKQEEEGFTEEDPSPSLFSEEKEDPDKMDETEKIRVNGKDKTKDEFHLHLKEAYYKNSPTSYSGNQDISKLEILKEEKKNLFWFEKPLLSLLFDYKRWNRPTRYIKNNRFENAVRNEMSQYFFYTCQNDGKQRISFTYPPSLSFFWEMIQRKISLSTTEKLLYDELYTYWIYTNEQKKNSLSNEFANRIAVLDKGLFYIDGLDKKTQLCNEKTKKEYLPKINDPFLNGSYRGIIKKCFSPSIINETAVQNWIDGIFINKIYRILRNDYNYHEFEQKKDTFNKKSISKEIRHFMPLMSPFSGESTFNRKGISLLPEEEQIGSEDQEKFLKFLVDAIIGLTKNNKLIKKSIELTETEIIKKVPYWSYTLIDELEQQEKITDDDVPTDHQIRSRKAKRVVILNDNEDNIKNIDKNKSDQPEEVAEVALVRYSQQSDFRRDLVKGSMRVQRRKIVIWKLFQANIHSPLFLNRQKNLSLFYSHISTLIKRILKNYREKNKEFKIPDYYSEEEKTEKEQQKENKYKEEKNKEKVRIEIAEAWDTIPFAQVIRGLMLVTQSILRKYIKLPVLIIIKNMGRLFLFQFPEWSEDFKEWKNEIHVKCTYNGVQLSETEFPKDWLKDGIQIKILSPFCLKPWHGSMLRPSYQYKMKNKKDNSIFLTVWGIETDVPFGSARKESDFFQPIFTELDKKIIKLKKNCFQVLKFVKEKLEFFLKVLNEKKKKIIKRIKKILMLSPIRVFIFIDESIEIKKEKDCPINKNLVPESSIQDGFMNRVSYSDSVLEQQKKYLANRTRTIKNQIEKISKEKKFKTLKLINKPNKTRYDTIIFKSPQNIGEILKRRNTRLICKSNFFTKIFWEKLFVDIFLYIINILRINIEFFLESTKNFSEKPLDNNEKTQERIEKINKKTIKFIKSLLYFVRHIDKNSKIVSDLSFLSQAYVFYKLSQAEVINLYLYKLKSVFQYRGTFLFLKNKIKNDFGIQGITSTKLNPQNLPNPGRTQWKNWLKLKSNYQYDLFQLKWSQLGPQKWRNRVTEYCEVEKKNLQKNKNNSDKKDQLLNAKNIKNSENYLLLDQNDNLKKNERYNIVGYNFIFYEDKKDSYSYGEPLQGNKNHEFFYTYNYHIPKEKLIDMWWSIPITNYLGINRIPDIDKNKNRKYFDWKIFDFCLRKKMDIAAWINISSTSTENTKTEPKNYKIVDQIEKPDIFYRTIYKKIKESHKKRIYFDWMGMNEEILNRGILNPEFCLFPKFFLLYNEYKMKPWVIPINSLFSNCNRIENFSEKKNINRTKKTNPSTTSGISNEKKSLELENRNQDEKKLISQRDSGPDVQKNFEFVISKHQKYIQENYIGSDIKNSRKKKQDKSNPEAEIHFYLKRYFLFQLKWDNPLNEKVMNNIKIYCLLLSLTNPREIAISSIERREMSLNIFMIQKDLMFTRLLKEGMFFIEPIRLSIKDNGPFILYQTIGISLIHKSKHQNNQKINIDSIDKKNPDEWIPRYGFDLLVPETILSRRRHRKWRILMCLNSNNNKGMYRNAVFYNRNHIKNCSQFFDENKDLSHENNPVIKFKAFLWPNYRLEDLACMNRYWFDTNNGSRFSLLRIRMYPRLKMHL